MDAKGVEGQVLDAKAKRKNRFVSGAPGDEKKFTRAAAKTYFLIKKIMFDAYWSSKNIVFTYDKFKSYI